MQEVLGCATKKMFLWEIIKITRPDGHFKLRAKPNWLGLSTQINCHMGHIATYSWAWNRVTPSQSQGNPFTVTPYHPLGAWLVEENVIPSQFPGSVSWPRFKPTLCCWQHQSLGTLNLTALERHARRCLRLQLLPLYNIGFKNVMLKDTGVTMGTRTQTLLFRNARVWVRCF